MILESGGYDENALAAGNRCCVKSAWGTVGEGFGFFASKLLAVFLGVGNENLFLENKSLILSLEN